MTNRAMLELVATTKQYTLNRSPTLEKINLKISENEFVSIVGPSGCGKTTFLRLVSGLEKVTSGKVFIGGNDVTHYPANKRGVNLVFQGYALYPHMTVFENLAFPMKLRKMPKKTILKEVTEILSILEIREIQNSLPKHISGGQQQRVAIGRALAKKSKLLLMDEPFSNLDPTMRSRLRSELKNLTDHLQLTVVYVTHDNIEALTLSDRIVFLNKGRIQQVADTYEIQTSPVDIAVASFFATTPLNIFLCTVRDGHFTLFDKQFPLSFDCSKRKIIVTIKAEACSLGVYKPGMADTQSESAGEEYTFHGKINLVETIGTNNITYVEMPNGASLDQEGDPVSQTFLGLMNNKLFYVSTAKDTKLKRNMSAKVSFSRKDLHFFDCVTGKSIS